MDMNQDVILIGRYTDDVSDEQKQSDQPRIQQAIESAKIELAAMNLDVNKPEDIAKANTHIETVVNSLNIPGFSARVVSATEGALEKVTDLPSDVRDGIKQAMAIAEQIKAGGHALEGDFGNLSALLGGDDVAQARAFAMKNLASTLAHYAVQRGRQQDGTGAPGMYHDIGALLGSAMLSLGSGVISMDDVKKAQNKSDPFVKSVVNLCNRIAVMSFVGYIISESDQNNSLGIDREAMIEDLRAVLDGKAEDRYKEIGSTLESFADATQAKNSGKLN